MKVPGLILIVVVGVIIASALGLTKPLETMIPDWVGYVGTGFGLAVIAVGFKDAFVKHPRSTGIGVAVILIAAAVAIASAVR